MNTLITTPLRLARDEDLESFFQEVDALGFDIPCHTCRAMPLDELLGSAARMYSMFAEMSRARNLPPTIGINVYCANSRVLNVSEAQYHKDNSVAEMPQGFYASFASAEWLEHLKKTVKVFVQEYGYPWVLFGEAIYGVDIPGSKDRIHEKFVKAFPETLYPELREESPSYVSLHNLKADIMVALYEDLSNYAKSVGAERVGIMPRPFMPAMNDWRGDKIIPNCCDNARIFALPSVDCGTIRVLPDSFVPGGQHGYEMAELAYAEILGNASNKPLFVTIQAPGEAGNPPSLEGASDVVQKATIAAISAAPAGIGKYWQPEARLFDTDYAKLLLTARDVLPRMGGGRSPGAFIFSQSGTWRHEDSLASPWPHYLSLIHHMHAVHKWPTPTYHATALQEMFDFNHGLAAITLEEHCPLTADQVEQVLTWWRSKSGTNIVVIGAGMGLSADPNATGLRPMDESFPGLFQNIGVKVCRPSTIQLQPGKTLRLRSNGTTLHNLPESGTEINVDKYVHVERSFGTGCKVLFSDDDGHPILTCLQVADRTAYFLGLECNDVTAPLICQLLAYIMIEQKMPMPPIIPVSGDFMWNATFDGYLTVTNPSDDPAYAKLMQKPRAYWDVIRQETMPGEEVHLTLEPGDVRVVRCLSKTTKLIDVSNGVYVHSMPAGAGRAEIDIETGRPPHFVVKTAPKKVLLDGEECHDILVEPLSPYLRLTLRSAPQGRHVITMTW